MNMHRSAAFYLDRVIILFAAESKGRQGYTWLT